MLNYIRAEFYKVFRRKYTWITLVIMLALEALLVSGWVFSWFCQMTDEDADHVFERFCTADRMRTGQNTGLGLAIVQALAEQMGHTVTADLRDGEFTVTVSWKTVRA